MSEENKDKEEGVDFSEVEGFFDKEEEEVDESLEKEEKKIESLEEEKESIEKQKEELQKRIEAKQEEFKKKEEVLEEKEEKIEEKIEKEEEKVEELKEKEEIIHEAEEETKEIKEEIKGNRLNINDALKRIKGVLKREKTAHSESHSKKPSGNNFYERNYKALLIIPFIMLLLAVVQIGYQYSATGDFVNRGVELKGGITLTIPEKSYNVDELQEILNNALDGDVSVRRISQTKGLLIEASDIEEADLLEKVEEILGELNSEDYSLEEMGSSLGSSFFSEIIKAIIIAFVLMALVVFITFRVPAPSLAVILAALSDIIVTLAIFNLTGAKLGKGGIAAFLMLIGYSVDTDILLSTRVLKTKVGTVMDRIYSAMKTGLTMNMTTIAALIVAFIFTTSEIIRQIMTILIIGLVVDIINTWIQNVGILRLYLERKGK